MLKQVTPKILLFSICYVVKVFLLSSVLSAQYWDVKWNSVKSEPFIVYYIENDSDNANAVLKILEKFYPRLSTEIGYQESSMIGVFLCNSDKIYNSIVGKNFPKWSTGVALPANKVMIVKSNAKYSDPRKTVIHELTHIFLNSVVNLFRYI